MPWDPPSEEDLAPENLESLTVIMLEAFNYSGGRAALDAAIAPPPLEYHVRTHLAGDEAPLEKVFFKLWERAADDGKLRRCVDALFASLPGHEGLREWVRQYQTGSLQLVPEEAFERERQLYVMRVKARRQQAAAVAGFTALGEARGQAFVAEEIHAFRGGLRTAMDRLEQLEQYKRLHDDLHIVQTQVLAPLTRIILEREPDERDFEEAGRLAALLKEQAEGSHMILLELPDEARPAEEEWVANLDSIIAAITKEGHSDPAALRAAAMALRSLLRQQLPLLNGRLGAVARSIPFDELVKLLDRASGRAGGIQPELAPRLEQAARGLSEISDRLVSTLSAHDGWQAVDTALWAIEAEFDPDKADTAWPRALLKLWGGILARFDDLEAFEPEPLLALRATRDGLEAALDTEDWPAAIGAFRAFAEAARLHFRQVDRALLLQCYAVARLRGTLEPLVEGGA